MRICALPLGTTRKVIDCTLTEVELVRCVNAILNFKSAVGSVYINGMSLWDYQNILLWRLG